MKRKFAVPHTYVLLFVMVVLAALLTYIVPAGVYERVLDEATGKTMIDPESFHYVEKTPVGFFQIFEGIHTGMVNSGNVIFFIFIIGGAFMIIQETQVLDAGIARLAHKFGKRRNVVLLLIILLFSVLGGTMGMAEELIVFIPLAITLCKRLKLDNMVALAVVMVGARVGFTTGLINPFTVGVAQELSDLPMFSGLWYRLIWYFVILIMTCFYIVRYADKVYENPENSIMYGYEPEDRDSFEAEMDLDSFPNFEAKHKVILFCILICFAVMLVGVFRYGWYIGEISALFLVMGIICGILGRVSPNAMGKAFVNGAREMTYGALVVGVARGVLTMLENGQIVDTIIFGAANLLSGLPKVLAANGMYVFQLLLNFLIPSGSGQAAATMPIMAPLSDVLGITRQTAVLAFHYGDGFTNLVVPTLGSLMACIAVSKVPFDRYLKWVMPLMVGWVAVGFLSVTIATVINLGPF